MEPEDDTPLTDADVLTFGPVVESVVWTPMWVQEARAPIAVAAGRPKLGPIFNSEGIGKAVIIRPCMSRGRRVRGLPPIYTPQMLERHAGVFDGWPQFLDHVPPELAETMAKHGRSVKELGGQILKGYWQRDFMHADDATYGYQKGGVLAEVWATPFIRKTVGENPNLLHTSINAWPTSGKPGPVPWRPKLKGMVIEGIRRLPQGSVDYVVRGGAGGRLLLEGAEDEGEWPSVGEWSEEDRRFVVSLAESFYASGAVTDRAHTTLTLPSNPGELRAFLSEHAAHLLPALREGESNVSVTPPAGNGNGGGAAAATAATPALTEADVQRLIGESQRDVPTVEDFERRLREQAERLIEDREAQRSLSDQAVALIESAEGIPNSWKADLKARYSLRPEGPSPALLVESEVVDGTELSESQVLERNVKQDLEHARDLIAEAAGKPRVRGEGGAKPDAASGERSGGEGGKGKLGESRKQTPYWRERFASMGLVESAEKATALYGEQVEG